MKHFTRIVLTALLFFAIATPVAADVGNEKIFHYDSTYFSFYTFQDNTNFDLQIGPYYLDETKNALMYIESSYTDESYTEMYFYAVLPDFHFPNKLSDDMVFDLCVSGEEYGSYYHYIDEIYESYGPIEAEHCFDLTLLFQSMSRSSFLSHTDASESGKSFFKSKDTGLTYRIDGSLDDHAFTDAEGYINHSDVAMGYPQLVFDAALSHFGTSSSNTVLQSKSTTYALEAFNDYADPLVNPFRYLSIWDEDARDGVLNVQLERYLFDEFDEIIGSTSFTAKIPDSALTLSRDRLTAEVDVHAFGMSVDSPPYEGSSDESDDPNEPVPYEDDYVIHLTWHLSYQSKERYIGKHQGEEFSHMRIFEFTRYAGFASGTINEIGFDSVQGYQAFFTDHTKYKMADFPSK